MNHFFGEFFFVHEMSGGLEYLEKWLITAYNFLKINNAVDSELHVAKFRVKTENVLHFSFPIEISEIF